MKRPRVSIAALMGGVLVLAVGFAALKYPTPLGANALGTVLQGSLVAGVVGAALRRGPRRAFWIGFVVCGAGYTLLAFDLAPTHGPEHQRPELVTVNLLILLKNSLTGFPANAGRAFVWMSTAQTNDWALFFQTGQSLFALVVALFGGFLGRIFADNGPPDA